MKTKIVLFVLFFAFSVCVYAQFGGMNMSDFPAAKSEAAKVVNLDLKDELGKNAPLSTEVEILRNVIYVERDGMPLHLHILYPKGTASPLPCVVYIPGSAWMKQNTEMGIPNMSRIAARGYVVAIVEYRPSNVALFPAQAQDAKTAVRFMRKNAATYHVDVNNVFAWGDSSGGHTSLFLALTPNNKELDTDVYSEYSCAVNAAVNYFGPSELVKMADFPGVVDHSSPTAPEALLIGGTIPDNIEKARKASPVYYVGKDAAPIIMAHGDKDNLVHLNQSDLVAEALDEGGATYEYYCLLEAGHASPHFWTDKMVDIVEKFLINYRK